MSPNLITVHIAIPLKSHNILVKFKSTLAGGEF